MNNRAFLNIFLFRALAGIGLAFFIFVVFFSLVGANGSLLNINYGAYNSITNGDKLSTSSVMMGTYSVIKNTNNGAITNSQGVHGQSWNVGGSVTNSYGLWGQARNDARKTVNARGVYGSVLQNEAGGTITNAYAGYFQTNLTAGTITNGYGVYIANTDGLVQYGLYQAGADDKNYFAGNVGIGTTTPTEKLEVSGNIKLKGNIVSDGDICIGKCN